MNFLELLLIESLKNKNPLLDLQGVDRRVLQIASQDLVNYLKVLWRLVGEKTADYELIDKVHECFQENPKELEEFVDVWTGIWLRKWTERVKLLIGNEESSTWEKTNKLLSNAEPAWIKLRNRNQIQEVIIESLIKNGEICGTSILAENLLKMELGSYSGKEAFPNGNEQLLNLVNNTLRKARQLSQSKGPLIFVRIDKKFFQL
ncbi:MAG: hypothetical protein QXN63_05600 [Candidatus Bathyarchaeia archaeon]